MPDVRSSYLAPAPRSMTPLVGWPGKSRVSMVSDDLGRHERALVGRAQRAFDGGDFGLVHPI
jgi:hypothetical protein